MAAISASLVKELRDQTGAGMMDCKRALEETDGDLEAARQLLREKGIAQAAKRCGPRDDRGQGRVSTRGRGSRGAMVAVGCETEPVSNNEEFLVYAKRVLDAVDTTAGRRRGRRSRTSASSCRQARREHRRRRRRALRGGRRTRSSPRTSTRRRTRSACSSTARGRRRPRPQGGDAHRRSRRPVDRRGTTSRRQRSTRSARSSRSRTTFEAKPEQVREKIVEGRLEKWFFGADVLADQAWIHDTRQDGRPGAAGGGARGHRVRALRCWQSRHVRRARPLPAPPRPRPFRRVLLKLSGEALSGDREFGIDQEPHRLARAARSSPSTQHGLEIAIVIGGGNIIRGMEAAAAGMDRATADYAGMLATRAQLADRPGRARAPRRADRASCRRSRSPRSRSRTSAAARCATWRRAGSCIFAGGHRQPVLHDRHRRRAARARDRRRGDPDGEERRRRRLRRRPARGPGRDVHARAHPPARRSSAA